ncbi:TadE family protein [Streptomyces sp. NPDC047017]|uniref:TadE family protein n=1 Tax=Streptomyces sp. NPDC047017 TaxID=3155024 RepID=UPI0033C0C33F
MPADVGRRVRREVRRPVCRPVCRGIRRAVRRRARAARAAVAAGGDSGMTAIEFVLLTPVLFFMIFATIQFGLYFFADHVAQAAAQAGARKARATADEQPGAWRGEAQDAVDSYIRQLGPQLVLSPDVKMLQPERNTVGVEISARIPTVFPGLDLTVHAQSSGPVERFVKEGGN